MLRTALPTSELDLLYIGSLLTIKSNDQEINLEPLMSRSLQTLKHREGSAGLSLLRAACWQGGLLAQRQSLAKQTCSRAPTKDMCS